MNLWYLIPELCPCGGTATLRVVRIGQRDALQYVCRSCGAAGNRALEEEDASASFRAKSERVKNN